MLHPIVHTAIVESLPHDTEAVVRIAGVEAEDCSGCRIAALCRRDGDVTVSVSVPAGLSLSPGQRVEIQAPGTMSRRAVALLLLLPIAVLVLAVALTMLAGGGEGASVAVGLVALCLTFGVLYVLRSRVEASAGWTVTKILS